MGGEENRGGIPVVPGEDESPALALVNSHRRQGRRLVDALATGAAAAAWLSAHTGHYDGVSLGARELEHVHAVRAAIRILLEARAEGMSRPLDAVDAARTVNAAAAAAPATLALDWSGPAPRRRRESAAGSPLDGALAEIATDAIELLTGERAARLVACQGPGCVRLLLKDHPRRQWCSPGCGERARAARYYRRHRGEREDVESPARP